MYFEKSMDDFLLFRTSLWGKGEALSLMICRPKDNNINMHNNNINNNNLTTYCSCNLDMSKHLDCENLQLFCQKKL